MTGIKESLKLIARIGLISIGIGSAAFAVGFISKCISILVQFGYNII